MRWGGGLESAVANTPWYFDYTYNANLGNVQSIPTTKTNGPYLLSECRKVADVPRDHRGGVG